MKKLWQELDQFRPIPENSCINDCAVISKMKQYRDNDQVIHFLKGLREQYTPVRSQIMLMDPLPNIGKVYSLLVQQERQSVTPIDESKISAVATNGNYGNSGYSHDNRGASNRGRGHR
ncbi:flavonol sulfotransferase-like protein, partial [Trifolium medium]|nr:flavonol sulfotransferase-like protein [Trifolium medium]